MKPFFAAGAIPESPNFITFLYQSFQGFPWVVFLHQWESVFFSILVASLISLIFILGSRKRALIPGKMQNTLEWIVESLEQMVVGVLGPDGKKYLPFLGSLFIYILTMNLFGMIPLMKSPSSSLNITAGLAICVFCLVQYLNIKNMGVFGFLHHLAGSPKDALGWMMAPLMFPIELITQISRPVTLSLRLFGNILGEKILIGVFALFGISLVAQYQLPVGLPLQVPFMLFGMLTSFMQALVFTLLSTVYILLSVPHHEEEKRIQ